MWQTKYAAAIPKNLGLGLNFRPCSEGHFLSGRPQSVDMYLDSVMAWQNLLLDILKF